MKERLDLAERLRLQPIVKQCGYLDTPKGLTHTSVEAMGLIARQEKSRRETYLRKEDKVASQVAEKALNIAQRHTDRKNWERDRLRYRVLTYGDLDVLPRPIKIRRVTATERTWGLKAGPAE